MFSVDALALFARLRWPDLAAASTEELNVRLEEVWRNVRHLLQVAATNQRLQLLRAAADVALLSALLQRGDPSLQHYAAATRTLEVYGLSREQVEAAAYAQVLALANQQEVPEAIAAAIEQVPDLPRARPGRPRTGKEERPTVKTKKKHLDLAQVLIDQVEQRSGAGNFTAVVNEGLLLWLLLGDEHTPQS